MLKAKYFSLATLVLTIVGCQNGNSTLQDDTFQQAPPKKETRLELPNVLQCKGAEGSVYTYDRNNAQLRIERNRSIGFAAVKEVYMGDHYALMKTSDIFVSLDREEPELDAELIARVRLLPNGDLTLDYTHEGETDSAACTEGSSEDDSMEDGTADRGRVYVCDGISSQNNYVLTPTNLYITRPDGGESVDAITLEQGGEGSKDATWHWMNVISLEVPGRPIIGTLKFSANDSIQLFIFDEMAICSKQHVVSL